MELEKLVNTIINMSILKECGMDARKEIESAIISYYKKHSAAAQWDDGDEITLEINDFIYGLLADIKLEDIIAELYIKKLSRQMQDLELSAKQEAFIQF